MSFREDPKSHELRSANPTMRGDPHDVLDAVTAHIQSLRTHANAQANLQARYAVVGALEEQVLSGYERTVLEPRRMVWDDTQRILGTGFYSSAHIGYRSSRVGRVAEDDMGVDHELCALWRFELPQLVNAGDSDSRVLVDITASKSLKKEYVGAYTGVPQALLRLMGSIGDRKPGARRSSEGQLIEDCRELGIPLARRGRLPGNRWPTDALPSAATIHQKSCELLLNLADRFDADVYAAPPGGEMKNVMQASMVASQLMRPRLPIEKGDTVWCVSQRQYSTEIFNAWRQSVGAADDSEPNVADLLEYLKKFLPDPSPADEQFRKFASINALLANYPPNGRPGKPKSGSL